MESCNEKPWLVHKNHWKKGMKCAMDERLFSKINYLPKQIFNRVYYIPRGFGMTRPPTILCVVMDTLLSLDELLSNPRVEALEFAYNFTDENPIFFVSCFDGVEMIVGRVIFKDCSKLVNKDNYTFVL